MYDDYGAFSRIDLETDLSSRMASIIFSSEILQKKHIVASNH